jgi:threonine 3-dehydrogenase
MLALQKTTSEEGLLLVEVDEPGAPGPGEVLIEVAATGICGSDISIQKWSPSYASFMNDVLPVTLGHETAGRVIAIGEGVTGPAIGTNIVVNPAVACGVCSVCRRGDPVGCIDRQAIGMVKNGAFARFLLAPASSCYPLPANIPVELGALVEPLSVGAHALATGGFASGQRVIVFGPGPIGQGTAALAMRMGAREVVVVGRNDAPRLSVLRQMGIDHLVDMADVDGGSRLIEAAGEGFDLAVEATGVASVINQALSTLKPQGILVLTGIGEEQACFDALRVVRSRLQIRGASRVPPSAWETVLRVLGEDPFFFSPLVTHRFPLSEAPVALGLCSSRQASKVILVPGER